MHYEKCKKHKELRIMEQTAIQKLFEGYDSNQPYPFEIVDKGGAVGDELY